MSTASRSRRGRGEGSVSKFKQKLKDGTVVQRWRASAIVSRSPSGYGKRRTVYANTKDEALKKLDELRRSDREGVIFDADRIRFKDYAERWLSDEVRPNHSRNTYQQYASIANTHLIPAFGNVRLRDIKAPMVRELLGKLEREGKSHRTRQLARTLLSAIFRQAVLDQCLTRNPCEAVKPVTIPKREMKTLTPEQVNALLAAAQGNRFEALYHVALMTGARQGEIFALRWCDIDLENGVITIQQSMEEIYGKDVDQKLRVKSTKRENIRRVSIPASTIAVLREHRTKTSAKVVTLKKNHRDENLVFFTRGRSGGRVPLRKSNFLRYEYRPLLKAAGIDESFHFHSLRHTCASLLLANGESVNIVAEQLGHDPAMTLRVYAHALPGAKHDAIGRLEGMLERHRNPA